MLKQLVLITAISLFALNLSAGQPRPRVVVSSDIGGTDFDDFQSMVHFFVYADRFDIEGILSSPLDMGDKAEIYKVIDCYERDYPNLKTYSDKYPTPDALRALTKQGETNATDLRGHDGMPDAWEEAHGLQKTDPADRNYYTLDPLYTNLEVYLNELGAF